MPVRFGPTKPRRRTLLSRQTPNQVAKYLETSFRRTPKAGTFRPFCSPILIGVPGRGAGVGRLCGVGRDLGVALGIGVGVGLGVGLTIGVGVAVGLAVGVGVGDVVGVGVGVTVGVTLGVGVGVPPGMVKAYTLLSVPM